MINDDYNSIKVSDRVSGIQRSQKRKKDFAIFVIAEMSVNLSRFEIACPSQICFLILSRGHHFSLSSFQRPLISHFREQMQIQFIGKEKGRAGTGLLSDQARVGQFGNPG